MPVNQATTKKSRVRRERGPAWHRAATKSAILEAARELIARDGVEKTSLVRVAEKAGFAPTTVYAYFVRKADLIASIVADDLAVFAKSISETFPVSEVEPVDEMECADAEPSVAIPPGAEPEAPEPSAIVEDAAPSEQPVAFEAVQNETPLECEIAASIENVVSDSAAEPEPELEPEPVSEAPCDEVAPQEPDEPEHAPEAAVVEQESVSVSIETPPVTAETANDRKSASAPLSALEARIAQVEARRADPWLERRLREFERMLATLEQRVPATDGNVAQAAPPLEGRLEELAVRLDAVDKNHVTHMHEAAKSTAQKFEANEAQQRQKWNELRTLTLETTSRVEMLERERALRALVVEMATPQSPVPTDEAEEPAIAPTPENADAEDSYLAAARRAALAAETLVQADRHSSEGDEWSFALFAGKARTHLLLLSFIGLGLILAAAGFAFREGWWTQSPPASVAPPPMPAPKSVPLPRPVDAAPAILAAATDKSRSQLEKGLAYLDGNGVARDDSEAARWLSPAAVAGEPVAQYWLATLYEHGKGEPTDAAQAIRWYEAAALQGNLKAMYKLAVSYAEGWGARRNYDEAARWFARASEFGFVDAQYNLGVLYERGLGVPQSLPDAYKWYALAAAQGDKDSIARVEALSSQLSADDLATARQAVSAFKPTTLDADANGMPSLNPAKAQAATSSPPKN